MTSNEKLSLETAASLSDVASSSSQDIGAIYELLSANLPNLSPVKRNELQSESARRINLAQQLKASAQQLRLIAAGKN